MRLFKTSEWNGEYVTYDRQVVTSLVSPVPVPVAVPVAWGPGAAESHSAQVKWKTRQLVPAKVPTLPQSQIFSFSVKRLIL